MRSVAIAGLFLLRLLQPEEQTLLAQNHESVSSASRPGGGNSTGAARQRNAAEYDAAADTSAGSTYVPVDSWMYPALERLGALGYVDSAFFGLRPWTRLSIVHMLDETKEALDDGNPQDDEAHRIYKALRAELATDATGGPARAKVDAFYLRGLEIAGGDPLNDSFHFGQTIVNDDGRPYARGFNAIQGVEARAEAGPLTLSFRGEYQHAPNLIGPPPALQEIESAADSGLPVPPSTQTGTRDQFRLIDANLSYHLLGNEISVGKSEMWWGPGQGGAMLYSTNAEPIYMLRINRVEPLWVPLLSRITGPIRYDNFFGDLKGHRGPNRPWIFGNKISLHPTRDLEFGFSRTVEFAGNGYYALTFGHFLHSLFSTFSPNGSGIATYDPGDRRGNFDFRWRLPWIEKSVTLYADSIADDDPSPLANIRRSGWRPGIYLARLPGLRRVDLRFEAPYTNQAIDAGIDYTNGSYKDGYTNKGLLIGDWIGRDSTGYQAWLTCWMSPRETIQLQYRDAKIDRALWRGGGTQTDLSAQIVKRVGGDVEVKGMVQVERWLMPVMNARAQRNAAATVQITWFPRWKANR